MKRFRYLSFSTPCFSSTVYIYNGVQIDYIQWEIEDDTVKIQFPPKSKVSNDWAWVVRMNGVLN